jgi:hypothetical protein
MKLAILIGNGQPFKNMQTFAKKLSVAVIVSIAEKVPKNSELKKNGS